MEMDSPSFPGKARKMKPNIFFLSPNRCFIQTVGFGIRSKRAPKHKRKRLSNNFNSSQLSNWEKWTSEVALRFLDNFRPLLHDGHHWIKSVIAELNYLMSCQN